MNPTNQHCTDLLYFYFLLKWIGATELLFKRLEDALEKDGKDGKEQLKKVNLTGEVQQSQHFNIK